MPRFSLLLLAVAVGCRPYETHLSVKAPGPDSLPSPVAHLPVVFLPYDRDSILRGLERGASPRPHQGELDSVAARERAPVAAYVRATWRADSARRALTELRATLDTTPRNAPAYRDGYARFAALVDSLPRLDQAVTTARALMGRSEASLARRLAVLRADIQRWEDSTYRSYPEITKQLARQLGRDPVRGVTDDVGRVAVALPRGSWWVYARSPDANDPEGEWYWNVRVRGTQVQLDRANAIHRIRQ